MVEFSAYSLRLNIGCGSMLVSRDHADRRSVRCRRRLAAVAFLANISLDGSYRDTRISALHRPSTAAQPSCPLPVSSQPATCSVESLCSGGASAATTTWRHDRRFRDSSVGSDEPGGDDEARATHHAAVRNSGGGGGGVKARARCWSSSSASASGAGVHVMNDSCESMCDSVRSHKAASSASEVSQFGVVRCAAGVSGVAAVTALDGGGRGQARWCLLSRACRPLLVFSVLAPSRRARSDRRDKVLGSSEALPRRRHNSSTRAVLPVISDRAEPGGGGGGAAPPPSSHRHHHHHSATAAVAVAAVSLLLPSDNWPLDGQEVSYAEFLHPSAALCSADAASRHVTQATRNQAPVSGRTASFDAAISDAHATKLTDDIPAYHPLLLDNPETRSENHRTILTLKAFRSSIIEHMKPSELKRVTNEQFHEHFPHIQLTLSKLRSLKREMRVIADECGADVLTVAHSYVHLETLVLAGSVVKTNRKLVCGACLLLAAKMNDVKGGMMSRLIERIESVFRISRHDLLHYEIGVLVALRLTLHVPDDHVWPHLRAISARLP